MPVDEGIMTESENHQMKRNVFIALSLFVIHLFCSERGFGQGTYTDARDNKEYQTITTDDQEWFAENFAYLPSVSPMGEGNGIWIANYHGSDIQEAKALETYQRYGCFYSWSMAKKLAPAGWRLPTSEDWMKLIDAYGGKNEASYQMKAMGPESWSHSAEYKGFNALPAGKIRYDEVDEGEAFYYGKGSEAGFACANLDDGNTMILELTHARSVTLRQTPMGFHGLSVRYVRDIPKPRKEETEKAPPGRWFYFYDEAQQAALQADKPIYIFFYERERGAEPTKLEEALDNPSFIAEASRHFILLRLNCFPISYDEDKMWNRELAQKLVSKECRFPCMGIVDAQGKCLYKSEDNILNLKAIVAGMNAPQTSKETQSQTNYSVSDPIWLTDFEKAKLVAQQEDKPIYILFIGLMNRMYYSTSQGKTKHKAMLALMDRKDFSSEARKYFVLLCLDTLQSWENQSLAEDYASEYGTVRQYPCAGIIDSQGNSTVKLKDDLFNVKAMVEAVEKITGKKMQGQSGQTENMTSSDWFTDANFDEAAALAEEESKPFLCLFYKDVERKVSIQGQQQALRMAMQNPQFLAEAKKHFVLISMDCAKNEGALESEAQSFGFTKDGSEVIYPCIGIIDTNGNSCYKSATNLFDVETILKVMNAPDMSKQEVKEPKDDPTDSMYDNLWLSDLTSAKETAQKDNKMGILVVITNPSESESCATTERCIFNDKDGFLMYAIRYALVKFDISTITKAREEGRSTYQHIVRDFGLLTPDNKIKDIYMPHLWLLDNQGRPCADYIISENHDHPGRLIRQIEQMFERKAERDRLLETAASANGSTRAKLLNEALAKVEDTPFARRAYRDLRNQIIELDSENTGAGNAQRKILLAERINELMQKQQWNSLLPVLNEYFNCNPSDDEAQDAYWAKFLTLCQLQRNKDALTAADAYLRRYEPEDTYDENLNEAAKAYQVYAIKIQLLIQERQWSQVVLATDHCLDEYHFNINDAIRQQLKFTKANALFEMGQFIAAHNLLYFGDVWDDSGLDKEEVPKLQKKIEQGRVKKIIETKFAGKTPEYPTVSDGRITPDVFKSYPPNGQIMCLMNLEYKDFWDIYILSLSDSQKKDLYYQIKASLKNLPAIASDLQLDPEAVQKTTSKYQHHLLTLEIETQYWNPELHKYVDIYVPPQWSHQKHTDDNSEGIIFHLESPSTSTEIPYEAAISIQELPEANITVAEFEKKFEDHLVNKNYRAWEKNYLNVKNLSAIGYKVYTIYNKTTYSYLVYILGTKNMIRIQCITESRDALNYYMPLFEYFVSTIDIQ